jgi:hypothetical protein
MPQTINPLSSAPNALNAAIDKRQAELDATLAKAEKELYFLVLANLIERFSFGKDGSLRRVAKNWLLISTVDSIFDAWSHAEGRETIGDFVRDLLAVAGMTALFYEGMADADKIEEIAADDDAIWAAIGATAAGDIIKGSWMWEIWQANQVRQALKNVLLSAIKSQMTLSELTATVRQFAVGSGAGGKLTHFWRTYAYDLFNQVAEVKNEQFRQALDLHWFIYVGDVIDNTRAFCRPKAGKVFADIEADTEWPTDPDLIGKTSGIPYAPRIDRGRWNCRHRIRYITRELAVQLDKKKVEAVEASYGSFGI